MKKWMNRIGLGLAFLGLLAAVPAGARPAEDAYEQVPGVRQPAMRRITPRWDSNVMARIEVCRQKLPAQYRERFNFAWAVAKIDGLDKQEYYAHSGIQSLDKLSKRQRGKLKDISVRPANGHYYTLCVNRNDVVDGPDCWNRNVDTEFKIVEDLVSRLPDTSVKGRFRLYTDLPPCASCWNVLKQFMAEYTNVEVQVLYKVK